MSEEGDSHIHWTDPRAGIHDPQACAQPSPILCHPLCEQASLSSFHPRLVDVCDVASGLVKSSLGGRLMDRYMLALLNSLQPPVPIKPAAAIRRVPQSSSASGLLVRGQQL